MTKSIKGSKSVDHLSFLTFYFPQFLTALLQWTEMDQL